MESNIAKIETVEDLAMDLLRERDEFKAGAIKRGDLLASANHAGKVFKGVSLMITNALARGEVPDFPILGNKAGSGCGPAPLAAPPEQLVIEATASQVDPTED